MGKTSTRVEWQEHHLDSIIRYWSDGFSPEKNEKIIAVEYFIDAHRGKVVFKLVVEKNNV